MESTNRSEAAETIIREARYGGFQDSDADSSRFESESDPVLTAALWQFTMEGGHDDEFGTTDDVGWHALIGQFIVRQDSAGWIESFEFESEDAAAERFEELRPKTAFGYVESLEVHGTPIPIPEGLGDDGTGDVVIKFPGADDGGAEFVNWIACDWSEDEQQARVYLSIGDVRGALSMGVRRLPDGRTIVHVPHEDDSAPHVPLHPIHHGTFEVKESPKVDRFALSIELGNDAMTSPEDVSRALRAIADELTTGAPVHDVWNSGAGRVRDVNGNTVGSWEVTS